MQGSSEASNVVEIAVKSENEDQLDQENMRQLYKACRLRRSAPLVVTLCLVSAALCCGYYFFWTEPVPLKIRFTRVNSTYLQSQSGNEVPVTTRSTIRPEYKDPTMASEASVVVRGGEDPDPEIRKKRNKVKEMFSHAWAGYRRYAWGHNELRPLSRVRHPGVFPPFPMGLSIVDAIDTLWIMGFDQYYQEARDWIENKLSFNVPRDVSLFETTIRFVGGLLSMYSLTGDYVYKEKAVDLGERLLPALRYGMGLPYGRVNLFNRGKFSSTVGVAEVGTLHLELLYLSEITGDKRFRNAVEKIRAMLHEMKKPPPGLYPLFLSSTTDTFVTDRVSIGANGDSFYEYLLKSWLQSGKKDQKALNMYLEQESLIQKHLIRTSPEGRLYFIQLYKGTKDSHKPMEHLSCFAGGMLASAEKHAPKAGNWSRLEVAEKITSTCRDSYTKTAIGLGPEEFSFLEGQEAVSDDFRNARYYALRPEVVESYFFLWRLTKNPKYREWGWDAVQALDKYCRVANGFSGVLDVYENPPNLDDVQQSYFLAETLKYLYLLFSSDELFSDDLWVFNTEAHPLPIKGVNPFYRGVT